MILDDYQKFVDDILENISKHNIEVSDLEMDHMAYQASSNKEYDSLVPQFNTFGEMVSETLVGNRRVGIFKLTPAFEYKQYNISAIELIAPKENQTCESGLEHVEFVIKESFELFLEKYPNVDFDTSAINRESFPMLKLQLTDSTQVKFHRMSVLDMVEQGLV